MATTLIPPDFREFLRLFLAHEVRFLVGGYAVNASGHIRNTVNLDIRIPPDSPNGSRAVTAIREFGFADATEALLEDPASMLRMGVPLLRIELVQTISGVKLEDCWPRRVTFDAGGLTVPVISLPDLKRNKRAAARPKDLADLSELVD